MIRVFAGMVLAMLVLVAPVHAQDVKAAKKAAKVAMKQRDYTTAVENLKIMLTAKPDDKKSHWNLAYCVNNGNYDQSEIDAFYDGLKVSKDKSIADAAMH